MTGQRERAAGRQPWAAEALHESEGAPVWPADRLEHAPYQARAQLGTAGWDAAWQAGRANPTAAGIDDRASG